MSRLTIITDRALELASQAGASFKNVVPSAETLLKTGAAFGTVKAGAKVTGSFVRRHPVATVAAAAGVGLIAYAWYRKRKQAAQAAPIEGQARRIEARKAEGKATTTRARKPRINTPSASAEE